VLRPNGRLVIVDFRHARAHAGRLAGLGLADVTIRDLGWRFGTAGHGDVPVPSSRPDDKDRPGGGHRRTGGYAQERQRWTCTPEVAVAQPPEPDTAAHDTGVAGLNARQEVTVSGSSVFAVTFLGAAVEVIEMVVIVVGVGTIRGWRSTWLGAGAGVAVLTVLMLAFGTALRAVPIGALRLVVGSLLLIFGLQWLRKGIRRVSVNGLRGMGERTASAEGIPAGGVDWTAFVLSFKGVLLEGLEVAFIVVSVGLAARALGVAAIGAGAAFVSLSAAGLLARNVVQRIPRSALQLAVGTLLSSFGTFWAAQGLGVAWPGHDAAILGLVGWYLLAAAVYVGLLRRDARRRTLAEVRQ
jgi:uncharacterized membrane protein